MQYRVLGRTGLRVSAIGVGGWQLAGPVTVAGRPDGFPDPGRAVVLQTIAACAELGINFIDTAPIYGDGEGERRVGEAIGGARSRWIVATKFGMWRGPVGERVRDPGPESIRRNLEGSLRRLATDYVDVYLFHTPPPAERIDDCLAELLRLRERGLVRALGVSSADAALVARLARSGVDVVLYPRSLVGEPSGVLSVVRRERLGGVVRGVFEGGRLTARAARRCAFDPDDIRSSADAREWSRYAALEALLPEGWSMTALALRHVLDEPETHVVAVGGRTEAQFCEAVAVLELPALDAGLRLRLARRARGLAGGSPARRGIAWLRSALRRALR